MKRTLLIIFLPIFLNACALCSLAIPKILVDANFQIEENRVKQLDIKWVFSNSFTTQLLDSYDKNANRKFDPNEMADMRNVLISYIEPKDHLTLIFAYHDNIPDNVQKISFKAKNNRFYIENEKLHFLYSLELDVLLEEHRVFKLVFEDKDAFFDFKVVEKKQFEIDKELWVIPNMNFHFTFYEVKAEPKASEPEKRDLKELLVKPKSEKSNYVQMLETILIEYTQKLKLLMAQENSFGKIFSLVVFSFLYGLFHALGPGHGKTLVGSYFAASGGGWSVAALMALRIGAIHVAGAFLLVMSSIYIIQTFISKVLSDIALYTSYISGICIMGIAFWMLLQKLSTKGHKHSCSCESCSPDTSAKHWAVAFAVGIVPCPGTVVIFLFTLVAGNYFIGFLSAIAMALGMSIIIFMSSIFGQLLNDQLSKKVSILPSILEYIAITIMLILGCMLILFPVSF